MQLDADIEFKIANQKFTPKNIERTNSTTSNEDVVINIEDSSANDDDNDIKSLYQQFQYFTISENRLCDKNHPQKVV